jgi:hypothetical protein
MMARRIQIATRRTLGHADGQGNIQQPAVLQPQLPLAQGEANSLSGEYVLEDVGNPAGEPAPGTFWTRLRVITYQGHDDRMNEHHAELDAAERQLQNTLEEHIEATEDPPADLSVAVRLMYEDR